jgi:hypothetical protein
VTAVARSDATERLRDDEHRGDKRRSNPDRTQTPEEIDDPTERRDSTTPTLWERAKQHYLYFLTLLMAGFGLTAVTLAFGIRLVPDLLTNRYVLLGASYVAVGGIIYVVATRQAYSRLLELDWLVCITGTAVSFYPGEFDAGGRDEATQFHPHKGFTLFGHRTQPFTVDEIDPEAHRNWKNADTNPDDPAIINLDEAPGGAVRSDYGTIVGVWTSGIEPQTHGTAQLRATEPNEVDDDQYKMLTSQLRKKAQQLELTADEAEAYRQFIDENLDRVSEPFEEIVERDLQRAAFIADIGARGAFRGRRGDEDRIGMTDMAAIDGFDDDLSEFAANEDGDGVMGNA